MMAYKKTTWIDNGPPGISAPYLNNLETQYDEVKAELQRTDGASDIKPQAINVQIQDTAGHFTSANVEDALAELVGTVQSGKSAIASSLAAMNQAATSAETHAQLAAKIRDISKDANATTSQVLTGKTFYQGGAKRTGTMPNRGKTIITPGTTNKTIAAGCHAGTGYVVGDSNLKAENIKKGVNIFGVTGSFSEKITELHAGDTFAVKDSRQYDLAPLPMEYRKYYEVIVGVPGQCTVMIDYRGHRDTYSHSRLYVAVNDIRITSEHELYYSSWSTYTLGTVEFSAGDAIQIYARRVSSNAGEIRNGTFGFDVTPFLNLIAGGITVTTC